MNEHIKPIPGIPGYGTSQDGRVWSQRCPGHANHTRKEWREVKPRQHRTGYLTVALRIGGRTVTTNIHRIVVLSWMGPLELGAEVNHLDGNKTNNRVDNLEVVSPKDNRRHAVESGLCIARHNSAKPNGYTFRDFVNEFGAVPLARACGVDRTMPHKWAKGECSPTIPHAAIILKLAKGRLKLEDLVRKGGAK